MQKAGFKCVFWPKVNVWLMKFGDVLFFVPGSDKTAFCEMGWTPVPEGFVPEAEEFFNQAEPPSAA